MLIFVSTIIHHIQKSIPKSVSNAISSMIRFVIYHVYLVNRFVDFVVVEIVVMMRIRRVSERPLLPDSSVHGMGIMFVNMFHVCHIFVAIHHSWM